MSGKKIVLATAPGELPLPFAVWVDGKKKKGFVNKEEVATYLKIPRTALTDIENGQRRVEAIELTRLAKLYRQSVAFFTGEDEASASLPADVAHLARRAADLSPEDRDELGRFAEYLRTRARAGQG